jgi:hypothetical protein
MAVIVIIDGSWTIAVPLKIFFHPFNMLAMIQSTNMFKLYRLIGHYNLKIYSSEVGFFRF